MRLLTGLIFSLFTCAIHCHSEEVVSLDVFAMCRKAADEDYFSHWLPIRGKCTVSEQEIIYQDRWEYEVYRFVETGVQEKPEYIEIRYDATDKNDKDYNLYMQIFYDGDVFLFIHAKEQAIGYFMRKSNKRLSA